MTHSIGVGFSVAVGLIAVALAVVARLAARRAGDRRLLFVAGAFALFAVKALLVFLSWPRIGLVHTEALEIVTNVLDFVILALLAAPLLRR